jgi:GNAT superfamily N-acetyltransferase
VAEAVIGYYKGNPVCFAIFFHNLSTFLGKPGLYLEDLFVKPEYRGKGFGKTMLAFLAKLAKDRDCGRFEWAVLDWNKPAINFYSSIGAKSMDEWITNRLVGKRLDDLATQF